jgi:hypothetical protein
MEPLVVRTFERVQLVLGVVTAAVFVPFVALMVALFGAQPPQPVVALVAGVVGVISTTIAVRWARKRRIVVTIDGNGIIKRGPRGEVAIRWQDEHQLFVYGVQFWAGPLPVGRHRETRVVAAGGVIDVDMAPLQAHQAILTASTAASTPRLLERLQRGEPLDLGALRIEGDFVVLSGLRVPRREIESLEVRDGKLRIRRVGNWFATRVPARDVAHPGVAFELLRSVTAK